MQFSPVEASGAEALVALKGRRPVYFPETGGFCDCAVYDRYRFGGGHRFAGPAVVEERESTVVIPPGSSAAVDRDGNLVVDLVS
jgi:N-methylhydantoinase A